MFTGNSSRSLIERPSDICHTRQRKGARTPNPMNKLLVDDKCGRVVTLAVTYCPWLLADFAGQDLSQEHPDHRKTRPTKNFFKPDDSVALTKIVTSGQPSEILDDFFRANLPESKPSARRIFPMRGSASPPCTVAKPGRLNVCITDLSGLPLAFSISPKTRMQRLFEAYCRCTNIRPDSLRFFYQGERVDDRTTPEDLELSDGDCLDTFLKCIGD
jgi:small ubiquitin-related modifier